MTDPEEKIFEDLRKIAVWAMLSSLAGIVLLVAGAALVAYIIFG